MRVVLIRHGKTQGNLERRYVGSTDEPLCVEGRQEALQIGQASNIGRVYVTSMLRTQQTASLLFPRAEQVIVPGLEEMDFGAFEGRSADEMFDDVSYRRWVDGACKGLCPGGECQAGFCHRVCAAFEETINGMRDDSDAVFVVHGGTIMAIMEKYAQTNMREQSYHNWHVGNCGGFVCETSIDEGYLKFQKVAPFEMVSLVRWKNEDSQQPIAKS